MGDPLWSLVNLCVSSSNSSNANNYLILPQKISNVTLYACILKKQTVLTKYLKIEATSFNEIAKKRILQGQKVVK